MAFKAPVISADLLVLGPDFRLRYQKQIEVAGESSYAVESKVYLGGVSFGEASKIYVLTDKGELQCWTLPSFPE